LALVTLECIRLIETATGRVRARVDSYPGTINAFAFSPDGRRLAAAGTDGTVLVWDVTGRCPDGRWQTHEMTASQLESHWRALAGEDAAVADQAIWALSAAPRQAIPYLEGHLRPVTFKETRRLPALLADLDSNQFAVREAAARELEELGEAAEPALREWLTGKPSPEARRRAEPIVQNLDRWPASSPSALRIWRSLEVLEQIGTADAQAVLKTLAHGAPQARLTRAAKAALRRLSDR
jgi:hypothetical protein